MFRKKMGNEVSFWSVAAAIIILGAAVFALGVVEWLFDMAGVIHFGYPFGKVVIGVVVIALGYIVLELELMRRSK